MTDDQARKITGLALPFFVVGRVIEILLNFLGSRKLPQQAQLVFAQLVHVYGLLCLEENVADHGRNRRRFETDRFFVRTFSVSRREDLHHAASLVCVMGN